MTPLFNEFRNSHYLSSQMAEFKREQISYADSGTLLIVKRLVIRLTEGWVTMSASYSFNAFTGVFGE